MKIKTFGDVDQRSLDQLERCMFNPIAVNRVFGQDQNDLVMRANRLIHHKKHRVADPNVFWCKPTLNTARFQVVVKFGCKCVVLA